MWNIYKRTWQVVWAAQWQYRANLLMYLFYWVVTPIIFLAVWVSVATLNGSVGGLSPTDFVSYYLMMLLVSILTADITIHIFTSKIQDGSLSSDLMLPVHPVLTRALVVNLGFKALQLMVFIPAWLVLIWLFGATFSVTVESVLLGLLACVLGFLVNFFFGTLIVCLAFWTTRVYWFDQLIRFALGRMFSGEFVPLSLLPGVLQTIAFALPFQLGIYFPVQVMLNKIQGQQLWMGLGLQIVWIAVLATIFTFQWRAGLKKFSAVGA
jgi:ABC-2 type transport system permease protein